MAQLCFINAMTFLSKPLLTASLCAATTLFALSASAGEMPKNVVELFTSQGCSSCPSANEFVGKLADDKDKLVLTYGVTYWDYLGWKDTFGKREFTARQHQYGQALGIGNVYTPQIVLNGSAHSPRYRRNDVESMELVRPDDVSVDINIEDGKLVLSTNAANCTIIAFTPGWQTVDVEKGENHGRKLEIANVVKSVTQFNVANAPVIEAEEGVAYAALIHDPETRKILAASAVYPTAP